MGIIELASAISRVGSQLTKFSEARCGFIEKEIIEDAELKTDHIKPC